MQTSRTFVDSSSRQLQLAALYLFLLFPLVKFSLEQPSVAAAARLLSPRAEDLRNVRVWCCGLGYVCNLYGLGLELQTNLCEDRSFTI